jgi:hypothetical protein
MNKFHTFLTIIPVKKRLKRLREVLIAEALEEHTPSEFEDDIEDEEDKDFFMRCDKVEYINGIMRVIL